MVRVKDVAQLAGVSVGTVSNVLNGRESVAPQYVERVQRAVLELGFVPDDVARTLRAGTGNVIGLIVSEVHNPFFTEVARGADAQAEKSGGILLIGDSHGDPAREDRYLDALTRQRARGIVVHMDPEGLDRPAGRRLRERGVPIVNLQIGARPRTSSIAVDNRAGARLAAEHLVSLGRRRISFVGGPLTLAALQERVRGIGEGLGADAELAVHETLDTTVEAGRAAGLDVVAGWADPGSRPDAIIAGNDLVAIGIINVLIGAGIRVPEDVAVVGYDDIDLSRTAVVPLTTVRQPAGEIGAIAVRLLEAEGLRGAPPEQVQLSPELVIRDSTTKSQ